MSTVREELTASINAVGEIKNGTIIPIGTLSATLSAPEYINAKCIYSGTKDYWDSQTTLKSENCVMYYYTDVKNIKIGDGSSYLITLPFVLERDEWSKHMDYSMDDLEETLTLLKNF